MTIFETVVYSSAPPTPPTSQSSKSNKLQYSVMLVQSLALQHIRNHTSLMIDFSPEITVVFGDNATGKTTIVEALALLATGESFRADKIEEVLQFGAQLGRIKAILAEGLDSESGTDEVEVIITPGQVQGKTTAKRIFSVNGVRRRKKDAAGKFYAIVFRPEDMRLIEGSPSRRRQFIDTALTTLHQDYTHALTQYERSLKRRNKLLAQIRDGEQPETTLAYWDNSVVKYGQILQNQRKLYLQSFAGTDFPLDFTISYLPSIISEEKLSEYRSREIIVGHTLAGPHKDDFEVRLMMRQERRNVALYGSRGQQRLGVLWLKFCELAYARSVLKQKPVLLLDDILSELDEESQKLALHTATEQQTVITTANTEIAQHLQQKFQDYNYKQVELAGN